MSTLKGKVWKFGNNINTDEIIPACFLNTSDPKELASHCMEGIDPGFIKKISQGDIIVGGNNFGCGSSREHAPICIKEAGISCVVAVSFARIFYRNSFNIGLPIFETPDAESINEGDNIEVDFSAGKIINHSQNKTHKINPVPEFMQELIDCGGLIKYGKKICNL